MVGTLRIEMGFPSLLPVQLQMRKGIKQRRLKEGTLGNTQFQGATGRGGGGADPRGLQVSKSKDFWRSS